MDKVQLSRDYRSARRRQFTFCHSVPRTSWYSLVDLRRMKGWVDLGGSQQFWAHDPWNHLNHYAVGRLGLPISFLEQTLFNFSNIHERRQIHFLHNLLFIHPESFTEYLGLTLVFMWNSALQKRLNFCFSRNFLLVSTKFSFWQGDWALGYHSFYFMKSLAWYFPIS